MNNGYQQQQAYSGMYNPYNGVQYKPAYQKPLPQSTSPAARFSTGYETYDFQAPPISFMQQQQQENIQQQQYQYNIANGYNNQYVNQQTPYQYHHSQKEDDSDSPPPPPPPSATMKQTKSTKSMNKVRKINNKHLHRRKHKKKHKKKHKEKPGKPLPIARNKPLPVANKPLPIARNKPLPQKPMNPLVPLPQGNAQYMGSGNDSDNNYSISSDRKKHKKHRHKHKKKHRHKHSKKHRGSDSPPPPPPPASSDNQYTRRRGISGAQPLIYNNISSVSSVPSHLKLIGGKHGTKVTAKNKETIKFLNDVLLSQVLFSGMKDKFDELINIMYKIGCSVNECIIKQNEYSDTYFIIQYGAFDIMLEKGNKNKKIKKIGEMLPGKTFGDGSLLYSTPSAATLNATQLSVVWALDAVQFREIRQKTNKKRPPAVPEQKIYKKPLPQNTISNNGPNNISCNIQNTSTKYKNLINCKLLDFENIGILGVGSFGRVSLVKSVNSGITYSLKKIGKNKIIETRQQEHIKNEKAVLALLKSDFCVKLFGVYQDKFNIYFLMEPILGGEVFTILRWNKRFSEKTARFYAACVALAFEHLHGLNIIYRDLKPENLLISNNGYCKLVDFGFAKKINNSCTLCGTPDYLSPEVIQNDEQAVAVDWWTLGIFLYEMVIGYTPFSDDINGNVKMYEKILTYDVEFDPKTKLSPRVEHLICALLEKNPFQRLGSLNGTTQILNHPWFHGLDWDKMRKQEIAAPYIPQINGTDDLQNFDDYDEENINEQLLPDPNAYSWCKDF